MTNRRVNTQPGSPASTLWFVISTSTSRYFPTPADRIVLSADEVVDWLKSISPLDFHDRHSFLLKQRTPGTGEWLLRNEKFLSWKNGKDRILWLDGISTSFPCNTLAHLQTALSSVRCVLTWNTSWCGQEHIGVSFRFLLHVNLKQGRYDTNNDTVWKVPSSSTT